MLPFFERFSKYDSEYFRRDLVAGLTVAFVALPQSMAYALIAGVKPEYGLYAFIVGALVGGLFGSSRHLQSGPTNATAVVVGSIMVAYAAGENYMGTIFLLGLLAGILQLSAGLLKLGNLAHFISRTVLTGFIAGAGFLIIVNQLPNILGIPRHTSSSVVGELTNVFSELGQFHLPTLAVGAATMALALLLGKISPKSSSGVPIIPSYLLSLIAVALAVAFFNLNEKGVKIVGEIPATLPPLSLPLFDWNLIRNLSPGAVAVALIGFAEATSSAKVVASLGGYRVNNDRELVGQGLAKIAVSFFSGIPVSGSPSRTLLNYRAGAATRYANVFSAIFVTVIVLFFGGIAGYIPMAGLAGIVVLIAAGMVDITYIKLAIHSTTADTLALIATFSAALFFPLDFAIYIGVGVSLALFLRKVRRPRIIEMVYDEKEGLQELTRIRRRSFPEISIIHVEGDIFFGGVDFLEDEIQKIVSGSEVKVLILRMKRAFHLDATAIFTLMKIYRDLKRQKKLMIISGVSAEMERIFHSSGFDEVVGEENIYHVQQTLFQSTLDALNHALEYINASCGKEYKPVEP